MRVRRMISLPWTDPLAVLGGAGEEDCVLGLISGGAARWSYVARGADAVRMIGSDDPADPLEALRDLLGPGVAAMDGPPFSGGVVGLAGYGMARRIEMVETGTFGAWPDAALLRVTGLLAFDHERREVFAIGRGENERHADTRAETAAGWTSQAPGRAASGVLAESFASDDGDAFEASVDTVREQIARGDIFQANIARRWQGRLAASARPIDLFQRLCAQSPAPYSAYLSLPGLALVSNSPERFVSVRREGKTRWVETQPIKGTAPRGADAQADAELATSLAASVKDRAENLMIVDLMRNDLARVCAPGSVKVTRLFAVETFANVHHLVSTITGELVSGADAADLLKAVFPPGSITGAPKVQAMKTIAELEPPRGPFFGSLFWAGPDGAFDSSVLIRTLALARDASGWAFETRAGGGIVADSNGPAERAETEAKMAAIRRALTEPGS